MILSPDPFIHLRYTWTVVPSGIKCWPVFGWSPSQWQQNVPFFMRWTWRYIWEEVCTITLQLTSAFMRNTNLNGDKLSFAQPSNFVITPSSSRSLVQIMIPIGTEWFVLRRFYFFDVSMCCFVIFHRSVNWLFTLVQPFFLWTLRVEYQFSWLLQS